MPLVRKPGSAATPIEAASIEDLRSADENARWAAARAASAKPAHLELLAQALQRERSPRVREALFTSLSAAANARAVELLLPFMLSDDAQLRTGALDALHVMAPVVEPFLAELLSDGDADVRLLACELVRDVQHDRASTLLSALLECEALPNVCASAVEVLAETGDARALLALERCRARFAGNAFLDFAIRIAMKRIQSHGAEQTSAETPSAARSRD